MQLHFKIERWREIEIDGEKERERVCVAREGGREGGREGEREGGREREREGGREGEREGGRERERERETI